MKTIKYPLVLVSIASVCVLTGCVKLWQENLDIKTYMIEARRTTVAMEKPLAEKLWIDSVTVLPPSNVRNLILRESDVEFSTSYYTELLMSPAENFRNEIYEWMASSGMFEEVSIVERRDMSHRLAITVLDFYGDTVAVEAVLRIKATLFDEHTKGNRVILSNDYLQRIALKDTNAEDLIRAYNQGLAAILVECEKDMVLALD